MLHAIATQCSALTFTLSWADTSTRKTCEACAMYILEEVSAQSPWVRRRLTGPGSCTLQELSKEYIERQKTVDEALVKALSPELKGYLGARFTLHAGDRPHLMKF